MPVVWTKPAQRDVGSLSADVTQRVIAAVDRFAETGHGDVERLKGEHPPTLRLRVGDYRVRFRIAGGEMLVLGVGHRRDVYRR